MPSAPAGETLSKNRYTHFIVAKLRRQPEKAFSSLKLPLPTSDDLQGRQNERGLLGNGVDHRLDRGRFQQGRFQIIKKRPAGRCDRPSSLVAFDKPLTESIEVRRSRG